MTSPKVTTQAIPNTEKLNQSRSF